MEQPSSKTSINVYVESETDCYAYKDTTLVFGHCRHFIL